MISGMDTRHAALQLAVDYHNGSNKTTGAKPARLDTVVATAKVFDRYIRSDEESK